MNLSNTSVADVTGNTAIVNMSDVLHVVLTIGITGADRVIDIVKHLRLIDEIAEIDDYDTALDESRFDAKEAAAILGLLEHAHPNWVLRSEKVHNGWTISLKKRPSQTSSAAV